LERTTALAFAYRMTGQKEYADAAIEEMLTVCRFKDWNPSHYLDVAEMATAVSLGYDWLYDVISDKAKIEIREALKKHVFTSALDLYKQNAWWTTKANNWNEVCNCGLTIAALAVAEDEPEIAKQIVDYAIASIPKGLSVYKPDGAYPEGPMYWAYGSSFTGMMIMALRDVCGSDFGLLKTPGLDVTGDYYMSMVSPTYTCFNYADSGRDSATATPMMYALSHFYNRPGYALWLRKFYQHQPFGGGRFAVLQVLWYNPAGTEADLADAPKAKLYRGIQDVVTMRTAWNDPNAWFVGFKGGDNKASHGQLDIGSFVLDYAGVRWASDLGNDDYNLPGYFGGQRFTYYRNNNRSHNTLVIGDKIQNTKAVCKIIEFKTENGVTTAVCDMTEAYTGQAKSVKRTVSLNDTGTFTITDELEGVAEPVRWGMVTRADVTISPDGKTATLHHSDKSLDVSLKSDSAKKFKIVSTRPPTEKERQNEGFRMLAAFAEPNAGRVTIQVTLSKPR
ncbi:MAG: heparinase II/III family protein, partial [Phycisphaerales bacterium]|nr:heparinase II/III family protein [Phycisphaerales bacterium]